MAVSKSPAFFISGSEYKLRLNKAIVPKTSDGAAIGTSSLMWADLFLASGAVINFNNGDLTITHAADKITVAGGDLEVPDEVYGAGWNGSVEVPTKNALYDKIETLGGAGATTALDNLASVAINTALLLGTSDAAALGSATKMWSDLFVASGAVINFNNGDVTITHSANTLAFAGATSGYTFDDQLILANDMGFAGKDTGGTVVELLVANASNDAHFLANVGGGNVLDSAFGGFNSDVPFQFGGACCGGGFPTSIDFRTTGSISFRSSDTENIRITTAANMKFGGTADRGTTEGTNQVVLFNGTAPVGTLTNGISFYSASGEARVMDAAGNSTLLSPHDQKTNEWVFSSKHTPTGKVLRIDMERLMRKLDQMFGGGFIHEFVEK